MFYVALFYGRVFAFSVAHLRVVLRGETGFRAKSLATADSERITRHSYGRPRGTSDSDLGTCLRRSARERCNNLECRSASARDPEIGVPKPDTENAYTGTP